MPSCFKGDNMIEYPWWEPYKFAVLETDRKKLKDRVIAAEQAIRARALLDGQVSGDERLAIRDAMSALQMLRRQSEHDVSR
jgi:replicative DNA helicase